jgi:hypothetical protein
MRPARLCRENGGADMIWASALACSGDFLLRLAACQGKDLIAEARRAALAVSCVSRPLWASARLSHMPAQLDDEELADWRAGRAAVYQLTALTVGARLAVADA